MTDKAIARVMGEGDQCPRTYELEEIGVCSAGMNSTTVGGCQACWLWAVVDAPWNTRKRLEVMADSATNGPNP